VLARAGDDEALFLVPRDVPGLEIVRAPRFMHDPFVQSHVELRLSGCRVPESDRLPNGDAGARRWFTVERLMIAARCCGAAARLLDLAAGWASERVAFGRPIADYQGVSFPLADSLAELLAARLLTYHAAHELEANPSPSVAHGKTAIAKLYASEAANRIADRALQVFGGRGTMTENPVERHFRELRVDRIWEGTSEIQRLIVAQGLRKRGADAYLD
jgi:acyl-CoA dehydrogenase